MSKKHTAASKAAKGKDADAIALKAVAEKVLPHLNEAKPLRSFELTDDELKLLKPLSLLTLKPTMYIANVDEDGFENNPYLDAVSAIAEAEGSVVVPICNKLEAEISELEDDEKDGVSARNGYAGTWFKPRDSRRL